MLSASFVTKEVEEARENLISARSTLEDLRNNLTNLYNHYPIALDKEFVR